MPWEIFLSKAVVFGVIIFQELFFYFLLLKTQIQHQTLTANRDLFYKIIFFH